MSEPIQPERRPAPWRALGIAALCALVALQLAGRRADEHTLRDANEAGAAGRYDEARELARTLTDGTVAADARFLEAQIALRQSRFREARRALVRAIEQRPNDWRARRDLAAVLLFLGDRSAARAQYGRALALNPRMPPLLAFSGLPDPPDRRR